MNVDNNVREYEFTLIDIDEVTYKFYGTTKNFEKYFHSLNTFVNVVLNLQILEIKKKLIYQVLLEKCN